jgi:biofilm PGA synthesis N-glycosyltransferase PgaC
MSDRRLLIVSPCRNEAEYLARTIDSIAAQTVRPSLWVIVDDGSTDETPRLLGEYARRHDFIRIIRRADRGARAVGPGVIDAFYDGLESVDWRSFAFLCKLDLDLDLPTRYFEILLNRFERQPRLGTCSGKPYFPGAKGRLVSEKCGDEMSVGMTKLYRTRCFEQIGGFVREVMWDGIDCHRCRMLGWIARSWDEPDLRFIHLRPMGSSQKGILTGRMRHGFGQHFMGTSLAYMTASSLFRMTRPPFVVGGLGMWLGFVRSMVKCEPRYGDAAFRSFLRAYQWSCLFRGKPRTTVAVDARQESVWNPDRIVPGDLLRRASAEAGSLSGNMSQGVSAEPQAASTR